ncbi:Type II secretion system (T2SS), protein M subtype b [anaerobic digester metagenome]
MGKIWQNETYRRMALIGTAAVLLFIIGGVRSYEYTGNRQREIRDAYDMKLMELDRFRRILADRELYGASQARLQELERDVAGSRFITARTVSLAEVRFQDLVDSVATKTGLEISSRRVLKATEVEDMKELRLSVNSRTEIGPLNDFLHEIESQQQAMFFESLEIKRLGDRDERLYTFNAVIKAYTL